MNHACCINCEHSDLAWHGPKGTGICCVKYGYIIDNESLDVRDCINHGYPDAWERARPPPWIKKKGA